MSPPQQAFRPAQLHGKIQLDKKLKRRKEPLDLNQCVLKQLLQYNCAVEKDGSNDEQQVVVCRPVARLFRLCEGGVIVETTSWEKNSRTD